MTAGEQEAVLAELRLDLRDVVGVRFVATVQDEDRVTIQAVVDDPLRAGSARTAIEELARRHLSGPWSVELSISGAPRAELAIVHELGTIDGVAAVDVTRGPRAEVLGMTVEVTSDAAAAAVRDHVARRIGADFRSRRLRLRDVAGG